MPNRIIKESICTSENIDMLTPFQETVFVRLMVNCDDFGRFDGRPKVISSMLFPLRDISTDDIIEALNAMQAADLVILYTVDGRPFVQMKTWEKHQQTRATKSKYPSPDDADCEQLQSNDINCNQLQSDDSKCPRNRNRNTIYDNRETNTITESDDAAAVKIQHDHDRVLDAAEDAGFLKSNSVRAKLIALYADHGLDKMLSAIDSCVHHGVINLAYLEGCLKGEPKKPKDTGQKLPAQDYHQREYSDAQEAAFERMMALEGSA